MSLRLQSEEIANNNSGWLPLLLIVFGCFGFTLWLFFTERSLVISLLKEGHGIEAAAIVAYGIALLFYTFCVRRDFFKYWYIPTILVLCSLREMDMDKRPFTEGLFASRQYFDPAVPLLEKLISVLIVAFIIYTVITLWRRHSTPWLGKLRQLDARAWAVLIGFCALGLSKALDGIDRRLTGFGISFNDAWTYYTVIMEEMLEVTFPLLITLAIYQFFKPSSRSY